jgi:hypothetical protein
MLMECHVGCQNILCSTRDSWLGGLVIYPALLMALSQLRGLQFLRLCGVIVGRAGGGACKGSGSVEGRL